MKFVVTLTEAARAGGAGAVGGKAASLTELTRAGVAVPPGFAVTVSAFAAAMTAIDPAEALRASIEALDGADLAGIAAAAARLRSAVTSTPLPDEVAAAITTAYAALGSDGDAAVAVRSSATVEDSAEASFAGLQDTYLGVSGAASVLEYVRHCWASLYNDESVAYRRRLGLPEAGVAMAVVVQHMVAPRAAGVMFTRSPVTGDRSVVAIEGTWGLGSALVSGDVTPDSWVISKVTGEITGRRVSAKAKTHFHKINVPLAPPGTQLTSPTGQGSPAPVSEAPGELGWVTVSDTPPELRDVPCLTDDEIRALAAVACRVETHYGTPQDIEWALLEVPGAPAESRIVLLQSRPETVWASRQATPAASPKPRAADHVLALFGKPL